ncbi:hypothetical protein LRS06_21615 [Hymenobacter sp. J193]|uniref:hypothetical protein n=1 Tax=Hymenobacter sp. J193 TaxID=2898429 RepID=UPI002150D7F0|nr:hypothetical protein [Hymenobacter sp. J193]MCR5890328.1 hypothetical protein [Hymenobacter sp. J193]
MNSIEDMTPIGGGQPTPPPVPAPEVESPTPAPEAAAAAPAAAEKPEKAKVDWGQKLLDNKLTVLIALVVLIVGGVAAIWFSLESEAAVQSPTAAASTEQMDALTQSPSPPDTKEPLAAVDQAMAENARPAQQEELAPEDLLTSGQTAPARPTEPQLTPAEQAANRARMADAARAANTEQVQETRRDPSTGQYSQQTASRQRVPLNNGAAPRRAQWSATSTGNLNQASAYSPGQPGIRMGRPSRRMMRLT